MWQAELVIPTTLLLAAAFAAAPPPPWRFEPRRTAGEIHVVPVVATNARPHLVADTWVGRPLPDEFLDTRRRRTADLSTLPGRTGYEIPGALNARIGREWDGRFSLASLPIGGEQRIASALHGAGDLDNTLSALGRAMGGQATLFTWVASLEGVPLTASQVPGDIVDTPAGPVVVDFKDEPYLVTAEVGMALVASDGEIVLRYRESIDTVLSGRFGPARASRALADTLVEEVVRVWALDKRLLAPDRPIGGAAVGASGS